MTRREKRGPARWIELIRQLLEAREMLAAIPVALALVTAAAALVRDWFWEQPMLVQFTAASSAFMFLSLATTAMIRWAVGLRQLNVAVSVRAVEVRAHMRKYTAGIIWLHDLVITNREREHASLELEGVWELPGGKKWSTKARWEKANLILNEHQPTFRDEDVRFLFGYYNAEEMGVTEDDLRAARTVVILRDLVSRKERRFIVSDGQSIP